MVPGFPSYDLIAAVAERLRRCVTGVPLNGSEFVNDYPVIATSSENAVHGIPKPPALTPC
jgi:hypothetical protein